MDIIYLFDGMNFRDFGVYISSSKGLIGKPNRKKPNIFEYPDESGHVADLKNVIYETRTIELSCFIKAPCIELLIHDYTFFTDALRSVTETKELQVLIGDKSLSYRVYLDSISDLIKTFSGGENTGTFTLKFIEPDTSIYETADSQQ
jgi:hypothetical protein